MINLLFLLILFSVPALVACYTTKILIYFKKSDTKCALNNIFPFFYIFSLLLLFISKMLRGHGNDNLQVAYENINSLLIYLLIVSLFLIALCIIISLLPNKFKNTVFKFINNSFPVSVILFISISITYIIENRNHVIETLLNKTTINNYFIFSLIFLVLFLILTFIFKLILNKFDNINSGLNLFFNNNSLKVKDKLLLSALVNFSLIFTSLIFYPYETFLGNTGEFIFKFTDFFWIPIIESLFVILFLFLIEFLFSGTAFKFVVSIFFGINIAMYIQSMFLNGFMQKLDGTDYKNSLSKLIVNLIIWIVICLLPFIVCIAFKKIWKTMCILGTVLLSGVQIVALVSLLITAKPTVQTSKVTSKDLYNVASDKNVIVFLLDKFDQTYMQQILDETPDYLNKFKGFTYYPNTSGSYCFTHIAVPYLLTGVRIPEYDPTDIQYDNSYKNSEFFSKVRQSVDSLDIYTDEFCIKSEYAKEKIDNIKSVDYNINTKKLLKETANITLYRSMPFISKSRFLYTSNDINECITLKDSTNDEDLYKASENKTTTLILDNLKSNGLKINNKYKNGFKFIHTTGAHPGFNTLPDGSYSSNQTDALSAAKGSLVMTYQYLEELNRLGVYKNSTIIILADHGNAYVVKDLKLDNPNVNPLLIYKPAGKDWNDSFNTSLAPISHSDVFSTILSGLGQNNQKFGSTIDQIKESENRKRYYYWCFQDPEIKDKESCIHFEYEINGDSRKADSWKQTGKVIYPNNSPRHTGE